MLKMFACFRKIKSLLFGSKHHKWFYYVRQVCINNGHQYGWCSIMLENQSIISQYDDIASQTLKQLKSTNITSEIMKVIQLDYDSNNVFKLIVELFGSYIQLKYHDIINPTQKSTRKLQQQYHHFIETIRSTLVIYYELEDREVIGDDSFYNLTLTNFIIKLLFNNEQFSTTIFKIEKETERQRSDRIKFNIQKFQSFAIQKFQIDQKFELTQKTLNKYGVSNQINAKPYLSSIQIVKQIIILKNPQQKLKQIQLLIKQVQLSVLKFYQNYIPNTNYALLQLDSDNLISVLIYVIVQSGQTSVMSHVSVIKNYVNPFLKLQNSGYCLATLEACLQLLAKGSLIRNKTQDTMKSQMGLCENVFSYFEHVSNSQL